MSIDTPQSSEALSLGEGDDKIVLLKQRLMMGYNGEEMEILDIWCQDKLLKDEEEKNKVAQAARLHFNILKKFAKRIQIPS